MGFEKRVLVLNQLEEGFSISGKKISGICRLETEDGVCTLFLTVINATVKDGFIYKLMLADKNQTCFFDLGIKPSSFSITLPAMISDKGFCVGIYAVKNDIPLTIAYAKSDNFNYTISDFKKCVAEKCLSEKKKEKQKSTPQIKIENPPEIKPPYPPAPCPDPENTPEQEFPSPKSKELLQAYDDEAVATENYYEYNKQIQEKLEAVKRWTLENVQVEDGKSDIRGQEEKEESIKDADCLKDETCTCECQDNSSAPYYLTARKELDALFEKFPTEEQLLKIFPDSKFVKINYSESAYYVVGLVKEDGQEKYICYGVPGAYATNPPDQLAGYCTFIPLSVFNLLGDGYWIMFQDAITGECIKAHSIC